VKIYGPTTQCISKTYYQALRLSATVPNLCPQPIIVTDQSFDQWPSAGWSCKQPSFRCRLNSSTSCKEF